MTTPESRARREPIFNAPWPTLLLPALVLVSHLLFGFMSERSQAVTLFEGALAPERAFAPDGSVRAYGDLASAVWPFFASAFLHIGWGHALVNAFMLLALGGGVLRWTGTGGRGLTVFALIIVVSQIVGSATYLVLNYPDGAPAVGASGIASGLLAPALLILSAAKHEQREVRLMDSQFLVMTAAFVISNLVFAFGMLGLGVLAVAWEAHLGGYVGGAIVFRLMSPRPLASRRAKPQYDS